MSSLPIGVFDSGLGGLTVLRALIGKLPQESFIYLGDTARMPYGSKSPQTIARYSFQNASFLFKKEIKLLLFACHTASAFGLPQLRLKLPIPMLGVIESGAQMAAAVSKTKNIAVLGTQGTIRSGLLEKEIHQHLPEANVQSI